MCENISNLSQKSKIYDSMQMAGICTLAHSHVYMYYTHSHGDALPPIDLVDVCGVCDGD